MSIQTAVLLGRASITALCDSARTGAPMHFRERDEHVMRLHRLLDNIAQLLESTTARLEAMSEQAEAERNALALEVATLRERLSDCGVGCIGVEQE